uniref:AlNc14C19G2013 protein n=1 Tax=Albugo laibachii Nc14 TaxID=890382 RepID=F0W542_9STRA|nr:AlNc14C19G2013 [Albugo laibachii Nc14]|eukprot:CCA16233.1 AlNc14C19G2013 [Albugo laibachii Nc14]
MERPCTPRKRLETALEADRENSILYARYWNQDSTNDDDEKDKTHVNLKTFCSDYIHTVVTQALSPKKG